MKSSTTRLILIAAAILIAIIWYRYRQPRFVAGEQAPDFQVTLIDGSTARLSDTKGKYTLLQFWGSWCGPCRAENPDLATLYQKYHAQGFEIFSVAIEQNPRNWQRAIAEDGLIWRYHSMESADFGGPVSRQYNIKSIPTLFLLNPDGNIMGVNQAPDELDKILGARLQVGR
jgi:thiol-disulfide isomerase/thioredoxin